MKKNKILRKMMIIKIKTPKILHYNLVLIYNKIFLKGHRDLNQATKQCYNNQILFTNL